MSRTTVALVVLLHIAQTSHSLQVWPSTHRRYQAQRTKMVSVAAETAESVSESDSLSPKGLPCRLSVTERARTVAQSCISATLSTVEDSAAPFGSHVDYVLDAEGAPVMLLSEQSLHTQNVKANPVVSLFAQMPSEALAGQPTAAMARVSINGRISVVEDMDEILSLRTAYAVTHTWSERLLESPKFAFWKLVPEKIYYVGGFGAGSEWVDVADYSTATSDILALESNALANKVSKEKQEDLKTFCSEFLALADVDTVRVTSIDRLGLDLRITAGQRTEEYRVGFECKVLSMEDAKSEIFKIFQEAWEKAEGFEWEDMGPPVMKTQQDILR